MRKLKCAWCKAPVTADTAIMWMDENDNGTLLCKDCSLEQMRRMGKEKQ